MPELPAVEFTRRLIEDHCLKKSINFTNFFGESDELIFSKPAAEFVKSNLMGRKVEEVSRWGKQLWIIFSSNESEDGARVALLMHLGMTGFVQFKGSDRLLYESSPSNSKKEKNVTEIWPPKFVKFIIGFDNDANMAFCDARRFGKVDLLSIPSESDVKIAQIISQKFNLGFDPLIAMPSLKEFKDFLIPEMKRRINMKALLMQQTFVAGIGNWMADDILLLAGILPKRAVSSLTEEEIHRLHKAIADITAVAVDAGANKSKFPKEWLFHIRWQHGNETLIGLKVLNEKIAGRSTFWVPELQK